MEIKTIQCPSCGGNLKVDNPNLSLIYCQFCGCQISLETNRNKAYDTEQGRLDARGDRADEFLAKIEKIKDKLILNYNAAQEMEDIPGYIGGLEAELLETKSDNKKYIVKPLLIGLGVSFVASMFILPVVFSLPDIVAHILNFFLGIPPIAGLAIGIVLKTQKESMLKQGIQNYEKKLEQTKKVHMETEMFLKENAEVDIPPKFRGPSTLDFIMNGLKGREFVSLEEALFKAEYSLSTPTFS